MSVSRTVSYGYCVCDVCVTNCVIRYCVCEVCVTDYVISVLCCLCRGQGDIVIVIVMSVSWISSCGYCAYDVCVMDWIMWVLCLLHGPLFN